MHLLTEPETESAAATCSRLDAHVVFSVNFLAPNLIEVFREVAQRVRRLTILASVDMEANRQWKQEEHGLDMIVQSTWTITRTAKHPSGYQEDNYIHIPLDTLRQLRRLRPDAVVSLELGARSAFSSLHRLFRRDCAHMVAVYASERSEAGRGRIRESLRRRLLRRADWITYNGPSCRRLLTSLGADQKKMSAWNYAADPRKPFLGARERSKQAGCLRVLTVGQLSERKGVRQALNQLVSWSTSNPEKRIRWSLVGSGPLESELRTTETPANLQIDFHGHCEPEEISNHYRDNDVTLFPTLGDEWGLVVDESLFSGLPVLGSCHSQAATTLLQDGVNGFVYDPEVESSLAHVLDRYTEETLLVPFDQQARDSVVDRTPAASADQFVHAVDQALIQRGLRSSGSHS